MKNSLPYLLIFLLVNIGFTKEPDDSKEHYEKAYEEMLSMLNNETPVSFKRAVFVTENAYLDNSMNYDEFNQVIEFLSYLTHLIADQSFIDYEMDDEEQVRKSWAIYSLMRGKMDFVFKDDTVNLKAYTYDMEDFWGDKDWSKMFVSKLIGYLDREDSFTGNCHSLPFLYKILADEIGVDAYLAMAPNHTYIKQWSSKVGWYNTELTTGSFPFDKDIKWNSYIKTEAVANGVYMDTVSSKQSIAYVITDLAQGYVKKFEYQDLQTPIKWLESALVHYPNYINAMILKAELEKKQFERLMELNKISSLAEVKSNSELGEGLKRLENSYLKIHQLGYRRMPKEMYLNWLFRVNEDTTRNPHRFKTPQPFKDYGYEVIVATAGDGQNYEFYDQDSIARIGTIELNRLTGKIIRFVEYNYTEEMPDDVISRMYDPALGRFWQVDPLAEIDVGWSPYVYARNNPIRYTDPDGLTWKDQNEADKLKGNVQKQIDQLAKRKTKLLGKLNGGDLDDKQKAKLQGRIDGIDARTESLNGTIDAIDALGADQNNVYDLVSGGDENYVKKGDDGVINIQGKEDAIHVHEITHVALSLENGGLQFTSSGYLMPALSSNGLRDEISAYRAQFSFKPSSLPGQGVSSPNDIDLEFIANLKTSGGQYVYPAIRQRWENTQKQQRLNKKFFKNMEKEKKKKNGN